MHHLPLTYAHTKIATIIAMIAAIALDIHAYPLVGYKLFMGYLSLIITITGYLLYISSMYRRDQAPDKQIKPHPLSWGLFGFLTATGWLVQVAMNGQAGSWTLGVTAAFCFLIAALSFFKYQWTFDLRDWLEISAGVVLFVFYLITKTPTLSATLATLADVAGYGPTVRKGWLRPWTDNPVSFIFNSIKCIPALLALSSYSWATTAYLSMLVVVNAGVAVMLLARRKYLGAKAPAKSLSASLSHTKVL